MSEQKNGVFVSLIRKAVGLPTASSSCCSGTAAPASQASSCCGPAPVNQAEVESAACCGPAPTDQAKSPAAKPTCC